MVFLIDFSINVINHAIITTKCIDTATATVNQPIELVSCNSTRVEQSTLTLSHSALIQCMSLIGQLLVVIWCICVTEGF